MRILQASTACRMMGDPPFQPNTQPPRVIGKAGAMLMSVNGMIGAGIFALPALLHAQAGTFAPWLFLIFGLLFAAGTLIAARLASMFQFSGGPQLYIETVFGRFAGFQAGWILLLAFAAGRAATLYVLVAYLAVLFPALGEPVAQAMALGFLLAALTAITVSGTRTSMGGLAVGTIFKLAPILVLCGLAFTSGGFTTHARLPEFDTLQSVTLLVYFAYNGANSAAFAAGEFRNPQRDIPVAMLASLAVVITLYMMVQWAYIAAGAPQSTGDAAPLAAAGEAVMGPNGALLLSVAAIFSVATNALNFYIAGGRLAYGMADRGLLPAFFALVSPRFATPARAILMFSAIVAVMLSSGAFGFLASVGAVGSQAITLAVAIAFVQLMRQSGQVQEGSGRPGGLAFRWWPAVAISASFAIFTILQAPPSAFGLLALLLALGSGLYIIARRS